MATPCPGCGCGSTDGNGPHGIRRFLLEGDLDGALMSGLLDAVPCVMCEAACSEALLSARDSRRAALAARERFRAREARRLRRAGERMPRPSTNAAEGGLAAGAEGATARAPVALPPAVAAALARARARAAGDGAP